MGRSSHCCSAHCPTEQQPHVKLCWTVPEFGHVPAIVWSKRPFAAHGRLEPKPGCSCPVEHDPGQQPDLYRSSKWKNEKREEEQVNFMLLLHVWQHLNIPFCYLKSIFPDCSSPSLHCATLSEGLSGPSKICSQR